MSFYQVFLLIGFKYLTLFYNNTQKQPVNVSYFDFFIFLLCVFHLFLMRVYKIQKKKIQYRKMFVVPHKVFPFMFSRTYMLLLYGFFFFLFLESKPFRLCKDIFICFIKYRHKECLEVCLLISHIRYPKKKTKLYITCVCYRWIL